MTTLQIASAEKIRVAGRLAEEVARDLDVGEMLTSKELRIAAHDSANCLTVLWGGLAALAGPGYVESMKGPPDQSFRFLGKMAEIQVAAASIDGAELVRAVEDSGFTYRDVALRVMQIRDQLGFATPSERELLARRKGEA